jgi:pimeloyl-ACP methyl ester carboxylesterase
VPISYAHPADGSLLLSVVMLPATGAPIGDLVMNPGGPGVSGVSFLESAGPSFPSEIRQRFNLVSFDPRGIGASAPVDCVSPAGLRRWLAVDPEPVTGAQVAVVVAAVRRFVAGCEAHTPRMVLANLDTATTARDLDRLRIALGERKLTYLGFSYGTYLGALYAQEFGSHVRAMVLDGAIDPALGTVQTSIQQAGGLETDLHDFFAWCRTDATCKRELPAGAAIEFRRLTSHLQDGAVLAATPSPAIGSQPVNLGVAETGIASTLYSPGDWPELAQAVAQGLNGNGTLLAQLADDYAGIEANGSDTNVVSANIAISCLDHASPKGLATYQALARRMGAEDPDFGALEAWGSLVCAYWPVPPTGRAAPVHPSGLAPVLVVGSTRDPVTPYAWAKALAAELPGAVLLTRAGDGHTGYFASACVQQWADRYLVDLRLPPRNTVCRSNG